MNKDEIIAAVIAAKEQPEEHVPASAIAAPVASAPDHSALWSRAVAKANARVAHAAHVAPPAAIAPAAPFAVDHASMWKRVVSKVNAAVAPTRH